MAYMSILKVYIPEGDIIKYSLDHFSQGEKIP